MAYQQGSSTRMALAWETIYGTPPVSGYQFVPYASTTLGSEQGFLENNVLGFGRDPVAPQRDAVTVDGNVVVPIDLIGIGHWLKGLMGQPTTTGTTDRVHTFASGAATLPSLSIEKQLPQVPRFEMLSGLLVDTLQFRMQRRGLLQATVGLIGQRLVGAAATAAGTPTAIAMTRFGQFNGSILRNGAALGTITALDVNFANGLDPIETIRADGNIEGVEPGMATCTGTITSRISDDTLLAQADTGVTASLEMAWTLTATQSLTITLHAVRLQRSRVPIEGPNGVQVEFAFVAERGVSPARMATVVLRNQTASY